ncbi:cell envelope integrity protein TolA [Oceanicola sp. 22II-s10i]|uniref:cell envelope integrity protein TolA n=1 Tax=Oceanicola sp. 22II-s10i TaxID=1317116 RepID=UPI000B51EE82|nr:cell envelope integrity protein TolA [Oceanicola sp. 22II-s10i]
MKVPGDADAHPYYLISIRAGGTRLAKGEVFAVLEKAGTGRRTELAVPFDGEVEETRTAVNTLLTEPGAPLAVFRQVVASDEEGSDDADRQAKEQAEPERQAAENAEAERRAEEKAEADRRTAERQALEQAEAERQALKRAELERQGGGKARAEAEARDKAEAERREAEAAQKERYRQREEAENRRTKRVVFPLLLLGFLAVGTGGAWLTGAFDPPQGRASAGPDYGKTEAQLAAEAQRSAEDDARFQAALDAPRLQREQEEADRRARAAARQDEAERARQAEETRKTRSGFHVVKYSSGATYRGEFRDGLRHGQGTYEHPDGNRYDGEWQAGKKHGQGTYRYASGNTYTGDWENGQRHGQGVYTFTSGTVYEGHFKEGKPRGDGEARIRNGNRFKGHFLGAFGDARGVMYFASGAVRKGWVKDGKFHRRNPFPGTGIRSSVIDRSASSRQAGDLRTRAEIAKNIPRGHEYFFMVKPRGREIGTVRELGRDETRVIASRQVYVLQDRSGWKCWRANPIFGSHVVMFVGDHQMERWRESAEADAGNDERTWVTDSESRALSLMREDAEEMEEEFRRGDRVDRSPTAVRSTDSPPDPEC